ncbi:MAG TPA: choice-of-anchor Q domain-containing protein [Rudaea sp.]|nr:choice-of-anchor Q domain-containing protein [Rudaea sp.]
MRNLSRHRNCTTTLARQRAKDIDVDRSHLSRRPLAAACFLLFAASAEMALAAPLPINNCGDTGSGSLRASVASAATGETVTIPSNLGCNTIVLATAIPIPVTSLTIAGPGADAMSVVHSGVTADRVFYHQGTGTFTIQSLSVMLGNPTATSGNVQGGCILSNGQVTLKSSVVSQCIARGTVDASAMGGGVFAHSVTVKYSTLSENEARAPVFARGGAIYTQTLTAKYDNIVRNGAYSSGASFEGAGGGLYLADTSTILSSNISFNRTSGDAGGISEFARDATTSLTIKNSTISNNYAGHTVGGVYSGASLTLHNSTIAFNRAAQDYTGTYHHAPGLSIEVGGYAITADLKSSILSNNTYGLIDDDFSTISFADETITVSGDHNLIYANFSTTPLPSGTVHLKCPLLGSLRDNGGPTQTLALLSRSPAIDAGSNPDVQTYDQRQSPFARMSGTLPDIGAYEVQQDDIVFNSNLEGCPVLF